MRRIVIILGGLMALAGGFGGSSHFTLSRHFTSPHSGILLRLLDTQGGHRAAQLGPITFSRNSTWTCPLPDGGIRDLGVGEPCLTTEGLRMRPEVTNLLEDSEDFGGSAWIVAGTVTATPDGRCVAPNGAEGEVVTCTAGPCGLRQAIAISGVSTFSVFASAVDGGATPTALRVASSFVSGGTYATLGPKLVRYASTDDAGTGGAIGYSNSWLAGESFCIWGAQLETGSVAHDYCPSGSTPATCAAETATVAKPLGLSEKDGCEKVCIIPTWSGANPNGTVYFSAASSVGAASFAYLPSGATNPGAYDGVNFVSSATTWVPGEQRCFRTDWEAGDNLTFANLTEGTSGTVATSGMGAFDSTFYLGQIGGSGQSGAALSGIEFGRAPGDCR